MNSNIAHYSDNSLPTLVRSAARSFYDDLEMNYIGCMYINASAPYHERQNQVGAGHVSGASKHLEPSKHSVGSQGGVESPCQEKRVVCRAATSGLGNTLPGGSFVQLLNNDNDKKIVMMRDSQTQTDEHPPTVNNDHARSSLSFNSNCSTGLHQCNYCDKVFTGLSKLHIHLRSHTGDKPYPCHICPKRFGYKGHLSKHLKIHTGEKPFMCSVCYKRFIESGSLKRHMRTHTGEKPYACTLCDKTFSTTSNLTKHVRVHTGERPYKCDQCGKGFRASGDLKSHYRIHTKEKPYECTLCSKKFSFSHQLKIHTRSHTGEKPYSCEICQRPFSELGSLKRHAKVHMGK